MSCYVNSSFTVLFREYWQEKMSVPVQWRCLFQIFSIQSWESHRYGEPTTAISTALHAWHVCCNNILPFTIWQPVTTQGAVISSVLQMRKTNQKRLTDLLKLNCDKIWIFPRKFKFKALSLILSSWACPANYMWMFNFTLHTISMK
jgi:hypothetical protein